MGNGACEKFKSRESGNSSIGRFKGQNRVKSVKMTRNRENINSPQVLRPLRDHLVEILSFQIRPRWPLKCTCTEVWRNVNLVLLFFPLMDFFSQFYVLKPWRKVLGRQITFFRVDKPQFSYQLEYITAVFNWGVGKKHNFFLWKEELLFFKSAHRNNIG